MNMTVVAVHSSGALGMAIRRMFRLACATCAIVAVFGNAAESLPLVVRVVSGSVRGSGNGVIAFKGIPYAAPPTGNLRWRPPAPPTPWTGVRDDTTRRKACSSRATPSPRL